MREKAVISLDKILPLRAGDIRNSAPKGAMHTNLYEKLTSPLWLFSKPECVILIEEFREDARPMSARLLSFLKCERGVVAIIFALALIPLLLIAGFAVDYTRASFIKEEAQGVLDSAVLAAVSAKDVEKPEDRARLAAEHFKTVLPADLYGLIKDTSFDLTADKMGVKGTMQVVVPTRIMSFFGMDAENVFLASTANFDQPNRQLDMVFCIDATGSMQETIDAVTKNARDLQENLNAELAKRSYAQFGGIRVRVNFFRDFGPDQGSADSYAPGIWDERNFSSNQPPLRRSKKGRFFELPNERDNFKTFLANEVAFGGGDGPESGFLCLDDAIHSAWAVTGEKGDDLAGHPGKKITTLVPLIVIWTDANALPLDDAWSEKNPYFPSKAPWDMRGLRNDWDNDDLISQSYKTLVFFGDPNNAAPMLSPRPNPDPVARWKEIEAWDNYKWGGPLTAANKELVTKLVDALETSPSMPRLTQ
jgi:Flp pilus assembly protein TadG